LQLVLVPAHCRGGVVPATTPSHWSEEAPVAVGQPVTGMGICRGADAQRRQRESD